MALNYQNLDRAKGYDLLKQMQPLVELDPDRIDAFEIDAGGGLRFNYAAKSVDGDLLDALAGLAEEQKLLAKYRALASGEIMNTGEGRRVLHHLLRGELSGSVESDGRNIGGFYTAQRDRFLVFANRIRSGEIKGSTGKPFRHIVQIGIGGSDLGPRALYLALKNFGDAEARRSNLDARFISNVDRDDPAEVLSEIDIEATLFVLVSKSGTTQETLTNRAFVLREMADAPSIDPSKHIVAVTSETSPLAASKEVLDSFYIDDSIGGRYSATSAVGGCILSCSLGPDVFARMLRGAHEADLLALEDDILKNAPLLDALIGVYERSILLYPSTAVLPYSQALSRLPAHLQQLDMESNGKRVNRNGDPIDYPTGPVVFGEPGTNGQHSFYQLLHQGTDIVPLQFVGFKQSQIGVDSAEGEYTSQEKLNANLAAQIVAFSTGKNDQNPNRSFPGNRPSSLIYGEKLHPEAVGALLAHFENKVMFQGFLWNINSFDQEGVQLGKILAGSLLDGSGGPELNAYARKLGIDVSKSG